MGTRDITYIDPVTGLPAVIEAEDADLFGVGDSAARPASGDFVGDLWLLDESGRLVLQRWNGASWDNLTIQPPSSSVDNVVPRFDGTEGQLQGSTVTLDDAANMTGLGYLELKDVPAPANPGAGLGRIYKKTGDDGLFWKPDAGGSEIDLTATDIKDVKVSANDTTAGFLFDKIVVVGLVKTELNDGGNEQLQIELPAEDDQVVLSRRRTTTQVVTTAWVNVDMPTVDATNDTSVLEADPANDDRFLVKETGWYWLAYHVLFHTDQDNAMDFFARVIVDDDPGQVLAGSTQDTREPDAGNDDGDRIDMSFPVLLTAGTYLTLQIQRATFGGGGAGGVYTLQPEATMSLVRLKGRRGADGADGADGAPGPPGSGSTINVAEEGVTLGGGPFSLINFIGPTITAADVGGGQVDVTVSPGEWEYIGPIAVTTSTTFQPSVRLPTAGDVTLEAGTYILTCSYGWNHDATNSDFEGRVLQNGVPIGELHKQEPKDAAGGDPTGTTQRYYMTRRLELVLAAGNYNFQVEFRTDAAGAESAIWEASLHLERQA